MYLAAAFVGAMIWQFLFTRIIRRVIRAWELSAAQRSGLVLVVGLLISAVLAAYGWAGSNERPDITRGFETYSLPALLCSAYDLWRDTGGTRGVARAVDGELR